MFRRRGVKNFPHQESFTCLARCVRRLSGAENRDVMMRSEKNIGEAEEGAIQFDQRV